MCILTHSPFLRGAPATILAMLLTIFCADQMMAQSAQWQPDHGSLGEGQASEIQLIFEGCTPVSNPQPPAVPGLALELTGTSQSIQTFNTSVTRRIIFTFVARPSQHGTVRIPVFDVATDKGQVRVGAAEFEVGNATVGQSGATLDSIVQSRIHLPTQSVWAGEVFPIRYTLTIARRYSPQLASAIEWSPAPLTVEEWGKLETTEVMVGGDVRLQVTNRSRGMASSPGTITIKPAQQLINLQTGTSMFGVFARPTMEQYSISSPASTLVVKPLPIQAPKGFNGAVGTFTLTSKIVPSTAGVGEPITWTLDLAGTGNWPEIPGLPSREVSRDFRIVQPQPKRSVKESTLFDASYVEDVVLIPTRAGTYSIGPYQWSYFDPKSGEYKVVVINPETITITAPPISSASQIPSAGQQTGHQQSGSLATGTLSKPPVSPALPKPIPGEPISGSDVVSSPLSGVEITIWSLLSLPALALFWFALALRRARLEDPHRLKRQARQQLRLTLRELSTAADTGTISSLLRSWQHDSLILLGAPGNLAFSRYNKPAAHPMDAEERASWQELWTAADRVLYSENSNLPQGWAERALERMERVELPRFSVLSLFTPRNLLPFVASLAALLMLPIARGSTALEMYRDGRFSEAQGIWSKQVERAPTDWIARHNLSLSLEQQDRWSEAAAHATAAFLQHPSNEAVHRNWLLALSRAGYSPSEISGFLLPGPLHRIAQFFSPAVWQRILIASVWGLVGALGCLLCFSYGVGKGWIRPTAYFLGAFAVLLAIASFTSIHAFGITANRRSIIVWRTTSLRSIPTFADSTQKTSPLSPGTIASVNRTFLKWHQLRFSNGETGWVPASDTISLWDLK